MKRNKLLKLFQDEMNNAAKVDLSFFKAMEIELDSNHQAEVNAALEQFMAKAKLAKKSQQLVM